MYVRWAAMAMGLLLIAAACSGASNPSSTSAPVVCDPGAPPLTPPEADNAFANPGFEDGSGPWCSLSPPPFILSQDVDHSGNASARLALRADPSEEGHKISYLVQEIKLEELPEVISGYYRVENWNKGTEKQYAQFVVIIWGADNVPNDYPNHQIRYLLSGIKAPPFAIANAKFVFLSRDEPQENEWIRFERNLRDDFQELWGSVPVGIDSIRVLFEVRYDDKDIGEGPLGADVYYDDLYLGPAPSP